MALGIGQSSKGSTVVSGASSTAAVTTAVSGSAFVVGIGFAGGAHPFTSIADTINGNPSGNSWVQIGSEATISDTFPNGRARMYYAQNAAGGVNHIFTVTATGSTGGQISVFVVELTGIPIFDKRAGPVKDTSSPFASGVTGTTSATDEILVGFITGDAAVTGTHAVSGATPATGWTIQIEETDGSTTWPGCLVTNIVAATGAYEFSGTETTAASCAVAIATFNAAPTLIMGQACL